MAEAKNGLERSLEEAKVAFFRIARSNFQAEKATDREREQLAAAAVPITDPETQDYAAWRKSLLMMSAVLLGVYMVVSMANWVGTEDALVEMFTEQARAMGHQVTERSVRRDLRSFSENLDILDAPPIFHLLSMFVGIVLIAYAARRWKDLRRSGRLARRAWLTIIGTSIVISILPWVQMLEYNPRLEQAEAIVGSLRILMAMAIFLFLAPKLLAIFPGIVRTSLTLKTLLPQSGLLAHAALLFLPIYALLLLVIFSALCQVGGDAKIVLGLLCFLSAVAVFFIRAKSLLRVQPALDVAREVWSVRKIALAFNLAGAAFFAWALIEMGFPIFDAINFLVLAIGNLLLMMVMAADLFVLIIEKEHERTQEFLASPESPALAEKVAALRAAFSGRAAPGPEAPEEDPAT